MRWLLLLLLCMWWCKVRAWVRWNEFEVIILYPFQLSWDFFYIYFIDWHNLYDQSTELNFNSFWVLHRYVSTPRFFFATILFPFRLPSANYLYFFLIYLTSICWLIARWTRFHLGTDRHRLDGISLFFFLNVASHWSNSFRKKPSIQWYEFQCLFNVDASNN